MPLSIKHPEADRLARELADATGESLTAAVIGALRERLGREIGRRSRRRRRVDIARIQERYQRLPLVDPRPPDAIIGYDELGMPR
ncbi:MAG: type II toxin-antitoxin system VapB family antitoxin [Gemmatimonadaceae bacterium]